MSFKQSEWVKVKKVKGKGRGVFARRFIPEGTVIEKVPVLVMPEEEAYVGLLADYVFEWGKGTVAVALGYGSLYNHSYDANCRYDDVGKQSKIFVADRDINEGEEVTINYNGSPKDKSRMKFKVK